MVAKLLFGVKLVTKAATNMNTKKRILIIGPGMEIGGVERSLLGLLGALDYSRFDVDLFLFSHTGELLKYMSEQATLLPKNKLYELIEKPIKYLFKNGHLFVGTVRLLTRTIGQLRKRSGFGKNIQYHLCHRILTAFVPANPVRYDLALGFFAPHYYLTDRVIASFKIGWVHTDYRAEEYDVAFNRKMWAGLNKIATVSEAVKLSFCELYPELSDKVVVVENVLDPEFVRLQAREFDATIELAHNGAFTILSIGRFCKQKAFDEAISACKMLVDEGRRFRWYFIGYGPDEEALRKQIVDTKLSDYVVILGKKENPYPYIVACDLYAQPSRYEGKAVTVREAQILAKPVLITDFPTAQSQLTDGFDGHICPMGAEGIAAGVRYMMDNPQYTRQLAQNAANSDYSGGEALKEILSFVND